MSKFKNKTGLIEVEAIQFVPLNSEEIESFVGGDMGRNQKGQIVVATLQGPLICEIYDFIIKDKEGHFYACDPHTFVLSYQRVKE